MNPKSISKIINLIKFDFVKIATSKVGKYSLIMLISRISNIQDQDEILKIILEGNIVYNNTNTNNTNNTVNNVNAKNNEDDFNIENPTNNPNTNTNNKPTTNNTNNNPTTNNTNNTLHTLITNQFSHEIICTIIQCFDHNCNYLINILEHVISSFDIYYNKAFSMYIVKETINKIFHSKNLNSNTNITNRVNINEKINQEYCILADILIKTILNNLFHICQNQYGNILVYSILNVSYDPKLTNPIIEKVLFKPVSFLLQKNSSRLVNQSILVGGGVSNYIFIYLYVIYYAFT